MEEILQAGERRWACHNELKDSESELIYETQPEENTAKLKGYTFRSKYLFEITNVGDIGLLPGEIDDAEQLDEGRYLVNSYGLLKR